MRHENGVFCARSASDPRPGRCWGPKVRDSPCRGVLAGGCRPCPGSRGRPGLPSGPPLRPRGARRGPSPR
nr:MAG TPA: hypothetical protein [Caudoviricetes sp.]